MKSMLTNHKYYGTVKVGERGQIVIPKKARNEQDIKPGDSLIIYTDNNKILKIVKEDLVRNLAIDILEKLDKVDSE
jgi:AbrB family looped-hinge helix DNA binding protein